MRPVVAGLDVQVECAQRIRCAVQGLVEAFDVATGLVGVVILLVGERKHRAVGVEQVRAAFLAEIAVQRVPQPVAPRDDGLGDRGLDAAYRDVRLVLAVGVDDQVDARQRRLGYLHGRLDRVAVQRVEQDSLGLLADLGVVLLARHEHDAGVESVKGVAAQKELDAPAVLEVQDVGRRA